ncbi:MAG: H(+)/Cl(-) exchange transporter ClcA [Armatimonadota bacterium]
MPEKANELEPTGGAGEERSSLEAARAVVGEVRDFIRSHEQRRHLLPRALMVGLLAGLVAVAFRWSLRAADLLRERLTELAYGYPAWGWLLPMLYSAFGAAVSVWMVRRFAPETSGSGIPHLKAVLHRLRGMIGARIIAVKFLGGVTAIGGGLVLGREGPTVQMGGAAGQAVAQWFRSTPRERQTLVAAGAGAGLAAAFNAPLAGLVFVLEELQRDFSAGVFTAAFVAAVTADIVARGLLGQLPVFHVTAYPIPPLASIPAFLVLGAVAGVLGVLFNRMLLRTLSFTQRTTSLAPAARAAVVGAGVGLVGWFAPEMLGGGHPLVEETLSGRVALALIPFYFVLRFVLTMVSYGTGAPGGIFAPMLVLGAQVGLGVGLVADHVAPGMVGHPGAFAVVGMAAFFTAVVRAPLTGIVMIVEMTGSHEQMLPLLVACLAAYGVADLLGDRPVYEALLERDLLRSQSSPELEESLLVEMPLLPGAPFDGRKIRELGLPPGCLLITVRRGLRDIIPTAEMRLAAGDRLTAVVAPHAADAVGSLRSGTGS